MSVLIAVLPALTGLAGVVVGAVLFGRPWRAEPIYLPYIADTAPPVTADLDSPVRAA